MRLSFWVQIYLTILHLSEIFSEILWFVSSVRYHLSEMLWIFFHTIPAWSHDISTSPMIFRLYLLFLVFPECPCAVLRSSFVINMLQLFISFADTASVFIQIHEYNFSFQRFWNFEPLIIYTLFQRILPPTEINIRI